MADTLIARNVSKPKMQQHSNVTKKSGKKTPRRPITPGRTKGKVGRDLWMNALKKRQALSMSNVYSSAASPRRKTPTEFWVDTLRKTGIGRSAETNKSQSLTGLKKGSDQHYPFMSTPHYMRQMMGIEKTRKGDDQTARASPGTPAYKSPEEYYEEVMNLRKQIAALNHESATSKTKIRRLEEDNHKKEKEIEALLNPVKNAELRRTLGDRQADSGAVVHSLKQKILKLEMQLREKESSYSKLQADIKTTKIEEMRVQTEVLYAEVLRLQLAKDTGVEKPKSGGDNAAKVKALSETVIRLSRTNEQLQAEAKALKDDLRKAMDESDAKLDIKRDYADMNRKELLVTISKLEKKVDRAESRMDGDTMSLLSQDSSRKPQGKLELQGSVENRLHQLDVRESELLDEVERLKGNLRRSREEKKKMDESGQPVAPTPRRRQRKISDEQPSSRPTSSRRSSRMEEGSRPSSSRSREGRVENFKQKHAATSIQRQWRQRKQRHYDDEEEERVEAFRQERAAKKIQHGWLDYKHRHYEEEREEASSTIRSALRGHYTRRQQLNRWNNYDMDSSRSDVEDSYNLIQSSVRGHNLRQERLRNMRHQYTDDDDDSVLSSSHGRRMSYNRPSSSHRPSSGQRPPSAAGYRPSSGGRPGTGGSRPGTGPGQRPSSASRPGTGSKRGSVSSHTFKARYDVRSPNLAGDSDDDDIMF